MGRNELDLIIESGYTQFPPRLPEQPIFYPVLNLEYAVQIARDWNARLNEDKLGFVTEFDVRAAYISAFEVKRVGGELHEEYWIPAEDLDQFNENIVGTIRVVAEFRGNT